MTSAEFEKVLKKTINPGKCRESLVGNDYLSDVTFLLGENQEELKAHRFFLMTASPVFHEVFSSEPSGSEKVPITLKITDISRATMYEICRFAYSELVQLNHSNMLDILWAASKLQMKFLMEKSIEYICKDGINEHNVFKVLEENSKDNNMRITMKCFNYIEKNHQKCFKSDDFQSISGDLLRTMLQTCKVPRNAAKAAVAFWTSHTDNEGEDLDELIALISLRDDVDETEDNNGRRSDSESIDGSIADSATGRPRRARRYGRNEMKPARSQQSLNNQPQGNYTGPPPASFRGQQGNANGFRQPMMNQQQRPGNQMPNMNQQQQPRPNINNTNRQAYSSLQNPFLQRQKQQVSLSSTFHLSFDGNITRRNVKYSNLDLMTFIHPVHINEFHFVYDLSTTDREFDLKILDMSNNQNKEPLFYSKVSTKINGGPFTKYQLPRPCLIGPSKKIWISIEFFKSEHRLSFDDCVVAQGSTIDRLTLRRDPSKTNSAQIISNIVFSNS